MTGRMTENTVHNQKNNREEEFLGVTAVRLDDNKSELILLDQTLLPNEKKYIHLKTLESIWEAIYKLRVRGAPAIGIAAGYGAYLGMKSSDAGSYQDFYDEFLKVKTYLGSSRPTAVNLFWALDRMEKCIIANKDQSIEKIKEALLIEGNKIREEDEEICRQIGEHGLSLLKPGMGILTHCNAGTIATAKYGTALAPIYLGHEKNYQFKVFADETRPLLQGARLTSISGVINPLETPVGVQIMVSSPIRMEIFPSLAATKDFSYIRFPISQINSLAALSVMVSAFVMVSDTIFLFLVSDILSHFFIIAPPLWCPLLVPDTFFPDTLFSF